MYIAWLLKPRQYNMALGGLVGICLDLWTAATQKRVEEEVYELPITTCVFGETLK